MLSNGQHFFLGDEQITLGRLQEQLGTASMVTRWREANPELVGTEGDVVVKILEQVRGLLEGEELIVGRSCHLLLFKRD